MSIIYDEPLRGTPLEQEFTIPPEKYRLNLMAIRPLLMFFNDPVGTFTLTLYDGAEVLISYDFDMNWIKQNAGFADAQYHYGFFKIPMQAVLHPYRTYKIELSASGYTFGDGNYISWLKEFESVTNTFTDDTIWTFQQKPFGYQLWGYEMGRTLEFNDSYSSATAPFIEGTFAYKTYADDAEYVADVGSVFAGSVYYNTTLDVVRVYDAGLSQWVNQAEAGTITGSRGAPIGITAVGGITAGGYEKETIYVEGSGGAVDITANPQISAGNNVGDVLILIGTSDINTLQIDDGNGLELNGSMLLVNNSVIRLEWDGSLWLETARRD